MYTTFWTFAIIYLFIYTLSWPNGTLWNCNLLMCYLLYEVPEFKNKNNGLLEINKKKIKSKKYFYTFIIYNKIYT